MRRTHLRNVSNTACVSHVQCVLHVQNVCYTTCNACNSNVFLTEMSSFVYFSFSLLQEWSTFTRYLRLQRTLWRVALFIPLLSTLSFAKAAVESSKTLFVFSAFVTPRLSSRTTFFSIFAWSASVTDFLPFIVLHVIPYIDGRR